MIFCIENISMEVAEYFQKQKTPVICTFFMKPINKGMHHIVFRMLAYVCQELEGYIVEDRVQYK